MPPEREQDQENYPPSAPASWRTEETDRGGGESGNLPPRSFGIKSPIVIVALIVVLGVILYLLLGVGRGDEDGAQPAGQRVSAEEKEKILASLESDAVGVQVSLEEKQSILDSIGGNAAGISNEEKQKILESLK